MNMSGSADVDERGGVETDILRLRLSLSLRRLRGATGHPGHLQSVALTWRPQSAEVTQRSPVSGR
jgi:hypothetical protein